MFRINRSNFLTVMCMLFGLLASVDSTAVAAQWPVNAGPVHQAVPQYRARYPLHTLSKPKPATQTELKFQRVEPIADSIISKPIELANPQPAPTNFRPPTQPNPAAMQPSFSPKPLETVEQSTAAPLNRYPSSESASANSPPPIRQPKHKSSLKDKQAATKKSIAKKSKAKTKKPAPPAVTYDIFRDRNPLPIDPRKPNGICTTPNRAGSCGCGQGCGQTCGCGTKCRCGHGCEAPGLHGKPYQEREPGGCRCGDKKFAKCLPMFSQYWPRPFSAKLDEHFPDQAAARYSPCQKKRIVDVFDKFADFRLIDYQRTDNGYCGEDSDPYGCLGESRIFVSGAAGFPSAPVSRSASAGAHWR